MAEYHFAAKLRINVTALVGDGVVGKFLIVVEDDASMQEFLGKIQRSLARSGIVGTIYRVVNDSKCTLPQDECVGDLLRDHESVTVVLAGDAGDTLASLDGEDAADFDGGYQRGRGGGRCSSPFRPPPCWGGGGGGGCMPSDDGSENSNEASSSNSESGGMYEPASAGCGPRCKLQRKSLQAPAFQKGPPEAPAIRCLRHLQQEGRGGGGEGGRVARSPCKGRPLEMTKDGREVVQGPNDILEECAGPQAATENVHPMDPMENDLDVDWLVDHLTPKLKEWIIARFNQSCVNHPKYVKAIDKFIGARFYRACGSFVTVFMSPASRVGSDAPKTLPVQYEVARVDLIEFQRVVRRQLEMLRGQMLQLEKTGKVLNAMLQQGLTDSSPCALMLPLQFSSLDEVDGAMAEAERPVFGQLEGLNPVIIVDTSGTAAKHLSFVRASLKRILYSFIVSKSAFNFVRFVPATGAPRPFASSPVCPIQQSLREAEDFIDLLRPVHNVRMLDGLKTALEMEGVDTVYLCSSGGDEKQHPYDIILEAVRTLNVREVPIHCIGVGCGSVPELFLRRLAESNHGSFRLKRFGHLHGPPGIKPGPGETGAEQMGSFERRYKSWRSEVVTQHVRGVEGRLKQSRMTIGGQLRIIDVLSQEKKLEEVEWLGELKCVNRLLLASNTQGPVPSRDALTELQKRTARSQSVRVGGGFLYQTEKDEEGLDRAFEKKFALPWSNFAESVAVGPRVPDPTAALRSIEGGSRKPRFPRSPVPMQQQTSAGPSPRSPPPKSYYAASHQSQWRAPDNPWEGGPSTGAEFVDAERRARAQHARHAAKEVALAPSARSTSPPPSSVKRSSPHTSPARPKPQHGRRPPPLALPPSGRHQANSRLAARWSPPPYVGPRPAPVAMGPPPGGVSRERRWSF
uniref:Uncharacterized protein n=1 Tax=Chromera velia CCMP2878 TaxID=1169474 RepID=A0A0G4G0I3_9ALVE|eukprot:Cvel_19641.t1-p1 / transcript=Cvel_19641.t1 / gene=Cvel_19641 / organism=Chromera_velia_CCMP2878 / gene_product=hypothetical protein / transcript_product=hypothetical protein / location=Cvel_scaffold1711:3933-10218(+) / protein_length=910 / sequence_SO=supercontig / SO=protein_coding / is_pseudo=false